MEKMARRVLAPSYKPIRFTGADFLRNTTYSRNMLLLGRSFGRQHLRVFDIYPYWKRPELVYLLLTQGRGTGFNNQILHKTFNYPVYNYYEKLKKLETYVYQRYNTDKKEEKNNINNTLVTIINQHPREFIQNTIFQFYKNFIYNTITAKELENPGNNEQIDISNFYSTAGDNRSAIFSPSVFNSYALNSRRYNRFNTKINSIVHPTAANYLAKLNHASFILGNVFNSNQLNNPNLLTQDIRLFPDMARVSYNTLKNSISGSNIYLINRQDDNIYNHSRTDNTINSYQQNSHTTLNASRAANNINNYPAAYYYGILNSKNPVNSYQQNSHATLNTSNRAANNINNYPVAFHYSILNNKNPVNSYQQNSHTVLNTSNRTANNINNYPAAYYYNNFNNLNSESFVNNLLDNTASVLNSPFAGLYYNTVIARGVGKSSQNNYIPTATSNSGGIPNSYREITHNSIISRAAMVIQKYSSQNSTMINHVTLNYFEGQHNPGTRSELRVSAARNSDAEQLIYQTKTSESAVPNEPKTKDVPPLLTYYEKEEQGRMFSSVNNNEKAIETKSAPPVPDKITKIITPQDIDMNSLFNELYGRLEAKLKVEQERKGIFR